MSDTLEPYEQDMAWLSERMPDATENTLDAFAEKVSDFVNDMGKSVTTARLDAYAMVLNGDIGCQSTKSTEN